MTLNSSKYIYLAYMSNNTILKYLSLVFLLSYLFLFLFFFLVLILIFQCQDNMSNKVHTLNICFFLAIYLNLTTFFLEKNEIVVRLCFLYQSQISLYKILAMNLLFFLLRRNFFDVLDI